jgi:hypothetical protein
MSVTVVENVPTLVPSRSDADLAEEFRAEMRPILDQLVALQNRAARAGLQVGCAIVRDQFGRFFVQTIEVVKPL